MKGDKHVCRKTAYFVYFTFKEYAQASQAIFTRSVAVWRWHRQKVWAKCRGKLD